MRRILIATFLTGALFFTQQHLHSQGILKKVDNSQSMSFKGKTVLKTLERQFERLEGAIQKGDYKTGATNVKYIKKGMLAIKASDPDFDLSELESKLALLEGQPGEDPAIAIAEKEEAEANERQAAYANQQQEQKAAMQAEQRKRELEFAKRLKAQGRDVSRNAMGVSGPNVKLDFSSARMWPGVTLQSLLATHSGLVMSLDGKLQTPKLIFSFLPPDLQGGEIPKYDSFIKEEVMITAKVVHRASAEEMGTFYYSINPYQNTFSNGTQHQGQGFDRVVQLKEGDFDLKFYGTGTHFFTLPFKVVKKKATDPYSVFPEVYFLKGPWEDWAYIADSGIGGKKALLFKFFMDYDNPEVENEYKQDIETDILFKGTVYRGSAKVGVLMPQDEVANRTGEKFHRAATVTRGIWNAIGTTLVKLDWRNKDNYRHIIDISDLSDGNYSLVLEVEDAHKQYTKKTFPFKISGGKLIGDSSTTRGKHGDKYTFMEPGLGKTFIKAQ